jgi:hypothetical protein
MAADIIAFPAPAITVDQALAEARDLIGTAYTITHSDQAAQALADADGLLDAIADVLARSNDFAGAL